MRLLIIAVGFLASLYAQTYQISEIPSPTGMQAVRVGISPEGRLWVAFAPPGNIVLPNGELRAEDKPGSMSFARIGVVSPLAYSRKGVSSNFGGLAGSFYPQNGASSFFGEDYLLSSKQRWDRWLSASITPPQITVSCQSYTLAGQTSALGKVLGPFPTATNSAPLFTGGTAGQGGSLYTRASSACDLKLLASPGGDLLTAWEVGGRYLAERVVSADPLNFQTEIITVGKDGDVSVLASTVSANNPQIPASSCCDLAVDWSSQTAALSVKDKAGVNKVTLYNQGKLTEAYNAASDGQGLGRANLKVQDLKGDWLLSAGSSSQQYVLDKIFVQNTRTGKATLIASPNTLPGFSGIAFLDGAVVGPDGRVVFVAIDAAQNRKLFAATPLVPVLDSPSSVPEGGSVTLTGKNLVPNQSTTTVLLAGKSIPFSVVEVNSLTITVPTAAGTYTLVVQITGPDGSITASNTVMLTVVKASPPLPVITAVTPVFTGTTPQAQTAYAGGTVVTIWGSNLCPDFPQPLQQLVLPLPAERSGCAVNLASGSGQNFSGRLYFFSPNQVNVQLPNVAPGFYALTTRNNGQVSSGTLIQIRSIAPNFVVWGPGNYLALLHQDGSLVMAENSAVSGEIVSAYLTGLGQTSPEVNEGEATVASALAQVTVQVNGTPAEVLYAGLQGTFPGLYQINLKVPASVTTASDVFIVVKAGDGTTQSQNFALETAQNKQ